MYNWTRITEQQAEAILATNIVRGAFLTPPECQGQIVTRSYRAYSTDASSGIMRRTFDASDRSVEYEIRAFRDEDEDTPGLNCEPA